MYQWPAYSRPYRVTSIDRARALVDLPVISEKNEVCVVSPDSEIEHAGYVLLSTIACVCDTVDEVNMILAQNAVSRTRWHDLQRELQESFDALHGVSAPVIERSLRS